MKYDGLAGGKGVTVTTDRDVAAEAVRAALAKPDDRVVIEEFLDGPEVSLFCVVGADGTVVPLSPAQDFKRAYDGDQGPNTGGMGAYSPLPWAPEDLADTVVARIAKPTVAEMARRGTPFSGLLYVGLALTSAGPKVVEFNTRFGDPETQAVLARLTSPITELLAGKRRPGATTSPSRSSSPLRAIPTPPPRRRDQRVGGRRGGSRRQRPARRHPAGGQRKARRVRRPRACRHRAGRGPVCCTRMCVRGRRAHQIAGGQHLRTDIAQKAAR